MPRQTLTQQLADARRQLADLQRELDSHRLTRRSVDDVLESYKAKVREMALQVKEDNGWCDDGFNEVMRELELPELPSKFTVTVTVTAVREVTVELPADDLDSDQRNEDGAREYLSDASTLADYISSELGYGDWELTEVEVDTVEAVTD